MNMDDKPTARVDRGGPTEAPKPVKVRVTPVRDNYSFAGKTFKTGSEQVSISELGWDRATMEKAHADPHLVIEFFDKDGAVIPHETGYPAGAK